MSVPCATLGVMVPDDRAHLARPAGPPRGSVLVLGGAEGGHHAADADALAEEGFLALSWAYFGAPGLPAGLVDIPLEHLAAGMDELSTAEPGCAIGVLGGSRGGEAALLLASVDPRVRSVVSVVGSGVVTAGIDYERGPLGSILQARTNSWTHGGEPVTPALPHVGDDRIAEIVASDAPVRLRDTYATLSEVDADAVAIPAERSDAAILAISASEDAMWDSPGLSAVTFERLERAGHERPRQHVILEAGHGIAGPPRPPLPAVIPGPGVQFEMGGEPGRTAAAQREAWRLTLEWLADTLA